MHNLIAPAQAEPGLSLEEMKQLILQHFEAFVNQQDLSQADRSFAADFLDHDEPAGVEVGIEAAKTMMAHAYKRWPDLHVEVEDILGEGDKVMVRNRWTGTDSSSGTKVEFHGFVLWRFAKGKIVERWATIAPPQPLVSSGRN